LTRRSPFFPTSSSPNLLTFFLFRHLSYLQDLEATIWLEQYLVSSEGDRTVVITSHDQDFLDNVVDETMYIRNKTLRYFEGTPRQLEIHERKEKRKNEKAMGAMDKKKAHVSSSRSSESES